VKFYSNEEIEKIAEARLSQLEEILGKSLTLPIPIDLLAEDVLGLNFLWDHIDALPGETILAGLKPKARLIVLNEAHRDLFRQKPGLERSTKGHECGHWDLYVDKTALDHPELFSQEEGKLFALRSSGAGEIEILKMLFACPEGQELLRQMQSRADEPAELRAVNRYAAAISMPRRLLREAALQVDRTRWPDLYRLAEQFGVTISALTVRLQQLNLLCIQDGKLYESADQASGQLSLGF
jgi:hypothetical protein